MPNPAGIRQWNWRRGRESKSGGLSASGFTSAWTSA